MFEALASLKPGVTEIHVQPVIDTPEVRAISDDADGWIDDYRLVVDNAVDVRAAISTAGATLIGYRALRTAMRATT